MSQTLAEVTAIAEKLRADSEASGAHPVGFRLVVRVAGNFVNVEGWRYGDQCCVMCFRKIKDPISVIKKGPHDGGATLVMHACVPCQQTMGKWAKES